MTAARKRDDVAAASALITLEGRLLDEKRFEAWLDLYTEDAVYWAPAAIDQPDPDNHVSLFYDDKPTMRLRVGRLRHPEIHVQTPASRTCRLISILEVGGDQGGDGYKAISNFILVEYRPGFEQRLYAGTYEHRLVRKGNDLKISWKKATLINCDAAFPAIALPF